MTAVTLNTATTATTATTTTTATVMIYFIDLTDCIDNTSDIELETIFDPLTTTTTTTTHEYCIRCLVGTLYLELGYFGGGRIKKIAVSVDK